MPFPFDPQQIGQMVAAQIAAKFPSSAEGLLKQGSAATTPYQLPPQIQLPGVPTPTMGFTAPVAPSLQAVG